MWRKEYLSGFSVDEYKKDIKEGLRNSKEFVNLFLEHNHYKTDEDKDSLFEGLTDFVADFIIKNK